MVRGDQMSTSEQVRVLGREKAYLQPETTIAESGHVSAYAFTVSARALAPLLLPPFSRYPERSAGYAEASTP